jgi:hypothetical protein
MINEYLSPPVEKATEQSTKYEVNSCGESSEYKNLPYLQMQNEKVKDQIQWYPEDN